VVDAFLLFQQSAQMGNPAIEVIPIRGIDPLQEPSLVRDLVKRFLVWDTHVGGRRRVEVCPLLLPRALHEAAARAAEEIVRVVGAVAARARADERERRLYGFDDDTCLLAAASHAGGDCASLMRVDLLLDDDAEWKACEINADCPGGHNESFGLPRLARAAGFTAGHDPSCVVEGLVARLRQLARGGAVGILHATGYAEDLQVCAIVARELERAGTRAILAPATAPYLRGDTLFIHDDPIRAVYRYFPIEWMSGQRNVASIARAVETRRVATLSSFAHAFTQSKLAFARTWEGLSSLAPADREIVRRHVPETRDLREVGRSDLQERRGQWVLKKAMGRVGEEVFVGALFDDARDWTLVVDRIRELVASGEVWVAQRFVSQRPIPTPWGNRLVTLGAYVLDGRFAGYFARITPHSHVSHDAVCVPVFALPEPQT
jgi:glutathionylspermidine synthase